MKDDNSSVLDPDKDYELIRGLKTYASWAGIGGSPSYISRSLKTNPDIDQQDREMIKGVFKLKDSGYCGVVYDGYSSATLPRKFMALTGALVRNYKDVFYATMNVYLAGLMDGLPVVDHRVTFIPDFTTQGQDKVPSWKRDIIIGHLMEKQAEGKIMIVGVRDQDRLGDIYGAGIKEFIEGSYDLVEAT